MDIKNSFAKILQLIKKYKYAAIVLIIGLILMAIPGADSEKEVQMNVSQENSISQTSLEKRLCEILSEVDGAGKVCVILTEEEGEEIVFQTNDDTTQSSDSSVSSSNTVTITDAQRNQNGLVRQRIPPRYLGAIIVCQGGNIPAVQLSIVDAVSKITGLGANQISVLKMK